MQVDRPAVTVTSASELMRWAASIRVRRAPIHLRLELPALSQPEHLLWQRQIERAHNDCGCSAATISLLGFIAAVVPYAIVVGFAQPLWLVAIAMVAAAIGALFIGKVVGYVWSRTRLRRQVAIVIQLMEGKGADGSHP